ncbi:MAG: RDD family protein [Micrococcales bacterium]|nr:RDD family protein [Micrococcales bacterium]
MTTSQTHKDVPVLVRPAEVAPIAPRLAALAVDQVLVLVGAGFVMSLWSLAAGNWIAAFWVTAALIETVQIFYEAITGATLGGWVARVRTVSASTKWPAGLIAVVIRRLVLTAAGVVVPVVGAYVVAGSGYWSPNATRRGWHDWAADTLVLCDWAVPDRQARMEETARRAAARRVAEGDTDKCEPVTVDIAGTFDEDESTVEVVPHPTNGVPVVEPEDQAGPPLLSNGPKDESRYPGARHRATTLGLGRPRGSRPSGRHREPEAAPSWNPRPVWPPLVDDVELTRMSVNDVLRDGMRLVFDSGTRVDVVGHGVVGRDLTGVLPPPAHPVVIDDPQRTVSRVHFQFGIEPGRPALWVMDESSTNGTILIRPDGGARVLPPGVRAVIGAGWQVRFGERAAVVEAVEPRPDRPNVQVCEEVNVAAV